MSLLKVISSAKKKKYLIVNESDLRELQSHSEVIIEKDTYISDKIRLLKFNNDLVLQEKSTKDEYLIRIVKTKKEAECFIEQRLEIYNRMWDGCGCKVKYYE